MSPSRLFLTATFVLAVGSSAMAAGAIAVDDDTDLAAGKGGYGIGSGEPTREAAAKAAMKECKLHGNTSCRVVVRYDVCGAYASGKTYYGVGWGNSVEEARRKALEQCGEKSCKILASDC